MARKSTCVTVPKGNPKMYSFTGKSPGNNLAKNQKNHFFVTLTPTHSSDELKITQWDSITTKMKKSVVLNAFWLIFCVLTVKIHLSTHGYFLKIKLSSISKYENFHNCVIEYMALMHKHESLDHPLTDLSWPHVIFHPTTQHEQTQSHLS